MENFHVSTSADWSSVLSKKACWKGENVDASSGWTASPPPGDHTHDSSVTGCRIQGRRNRFGGAFTLRQPAC